MLETLIYGFTFLLSATIVAVYWYRGAQKSKETQAKVDRAQEEGRIQPVSLHPYIDPNRCIGSGACVSACPEEDIIGLLDGKATLINASSCIGHGACFHACPVEAITLKIGTEERGVELPHVKPDYETNIEGIYIAGELGGMGLISNSAEQGKQACANLAQALPSDSRIDLDLVIIGAGPAGIAAALKAKELGLKFRILEQDSLGGTVFTFPRDKVVMTQSVDLPLYGRLKLPQTTKEELLGLWQGLMDKYEINLEEHHRVAGIEEIGPFHFKIKVAQKETFEAKAVIIAIGRRGSPRKLAVPGEGLTKVAYRLLEPEHILNQKILIVGGGDSAVEAALHLKDQNLVHLSYRKAHFSRIKKANQEKLDKAIKLGEIIPLLKTEVLEIRIPDVRLSHHTGEETILENSKTFIFAGGELPIPFLESAGITVSKTFGKTMRKH
jgi:thioredoxin reductase (NADPH)